MQNYQIEKELLQRITTLKLLNEELNRKQNITDTFYISTKKKKEFLIKTLQDYDNEINNLDNEIDSYYNELFGTLNNQKNKKLFQNLNLLKDLLNTKTEELNNRQEIIEQKENQLNEKLSQLNIAQLELFNQMITKINKEEDLENNILINTSNLKHEYSKIKNNYFEQISNEILKELNLNKEKKKRPHSLDNSTSSLYENEKNNKGNNYRLTRKDFFGLKQKRQLTRTASQEGGSKIFSVTGKNNLQNTINSNSINFNNNSKNNLSKVSRFHSKFFSQIDN